MKAKSNQLFILPIAILVFSFSLFGQAKSISGKEYESIRREAQSKVDQKIRRETTVDTEYRKGKVINTTTLTQEYLPPDKSKWLFIESKGLRVISRTELIYIGDFEYRKENDGAWLKRNLKGSGNDDDESDTVTATVDEGTEEYFLEEIKVEKETHKVLTKSTVNKRKTNFNDYKIWINKEGLIYKTTSNITLKPENMILTGTVTFDYNIEKPKIEAPIK